MAEDEEVKTEEPKKKNGAAVTMTLRKPVPDGSGGDTSELNFREPTAGDIERCGGNPVIIDIFSGETPKITFDPKFMTSMMSILAAVPTSTIRSLNTKDWNSIAWQLTGFFTPDL